MHATDKSLVTAPLAHRLSFALMWACIPHFTQYSRFPLLVGTVSSCLLPDMGLPYSFLSKMVTLCHCDKLPKKNNFKEERFISVYSFSSLWFTGSIISGSVLKLRLHIMGEGCGRGQLLTS